MIASSFWLGVGLGTAGSLLVGVVLWLLLPRGVVLTKRWAVEYGTGTPIPVTFTITNDSAVEVQIISVDGPGFTSGTTWEPYPNPLDLDDASTMLLTLDDFGLDIQREEKSPSWKGVRIPPGETMSARVDGIMAMRVRYRRSGPFGVLERRSLEITHLS